ncbi:MAG: hypothetical protein ABI247_15505 [Rhodanobacter sp.]
MNEHSAEANEADLIIVPFNDLLAGSRRRRSVAGKALREAAAEVADCTGGDKFGGGGQLQFVLVLAATQRQGDDRDQRKASLT